jgi:amino acid permease
MKRNIPVLGFIIGALTPLIGFAIVYFIFRNGSQSIADFAKAYWANNRTFAKLMTLSLLANLIPFVYCNSKRLDYTSRGIFVATMLYVVFIVLLMFVW